MEVIWGALEALTVDGCIFAGDTNMHADEDIPHQFQEQWDDAERWTAPTRRCPERGAKSGWTRRIRWWNHGGLIVCCFKPNGFTAKFSNQRCIRQ